MLIIHDIIKDGLFWRAEDEEQKIPGKLVIKNGGEVTISLLGSLEKKLAPPNSNLFRVYGLLQGDKKITLEKCFYRKQNFFGDALSENIILSQLAIIDTHCDIEKLTFKSCSFSVEGIIRWLNIKTFDCSVVQDDGLSFCFSINPTELITDKIDDNLSIEIEVIVACPNLPVFEEMLFKQNAYLKIISKKNMSIEEFQNLIFKITNFLNFSMDKVACINAVDVFFEDNSAHKIYYQSRPFAKNRYPIEWNNMLFKYCDISNNFGITLKAWLKAYDEIEPALALFFYTRSGENKYLDGRFLSMIQCLETYHRRTSNETKFSSHTFDELKTTILENCPQEYKKWLEGRILHGNEISLESRIEKILSHFSKVIDMNFFNKKFVSKVVSTRNYLTHYDISSKKTAATGSDLRRITQSLEGLFQLIILRLLGFTDEQLKSLVNRNFELANKIPLSTTSI